MFRVPPGMGRLTLRARGVWEDEARQAWKQQKYVRYVTYVPSWRRHEDLYIWRDR